MVLATTAPEHSQRLEQTLVDASNGIADLMQIVAICGTVLAVLFVVLVLSSRIPTNEEREARARRRERRLEEAVANAEMVRHHVLRVETSGQVSRLVIREAGIDIPVDAPAPLTHRLATLFDLNPGATVGILATVHPVTLEVVRYGALQVIRPEGHLGDVRLTPDGTHRVREVMTFDDPERRGDKAHYLVIEEDGVLIPVTCDESLATSVERLFQANDDIDILVDADISQNGLFITETRGIRAAKRTT